MTSTAVKAKNSPSACNLCGACKNSCALLNQRGLPGEIFEKPQSELVADAYACSLCRKCEVVCPRGVGVVDEMRRVRRAAFEAGTNPRWRGRLFFEALGRRPLAARHYPKGCDTVFFPGCNLAGIRPRAMKALYKNLGGKIPALGMVLDCCAIFTRDLGDEEGFARHIGALSAELKAKGIKRVVSACPTCLGVFRGAGMDFELAAAVEFLDPQDFSSPAKGKYVFHDPCSSRYDGVYQKSVRSLALRLGVEEAPTKHGGQKTFCCSDFPFVKAGVARSEPVLTSCAGCLQTLSRHAPATHLFDLAFPGEGGKMPGLAAQMANRLRLAAGLAAKRLKG